MLDILLTWYSNNNYHWFLCDFLSKFMEINKMFCFTTNILLY